MFLGWESVAVFFFGWWSFMHGNTYLGWVIRRIFYFGMLLVLAVLLFFPDDSRHHCCCLSFLSDLWVFDDTFFLSRMGR